MDALLTLHETAERLRVSTRTLRRYRRAGLLPTFRGPGRLRYVRVADVEKLIRPEPAPPPTDVEGSVRRLLAPQ